MTLEGEGRPDAAPPHDLETDAVHQAERAPGGDELSARGRIMNLSRYPNDAQNGHDIPFEDAEGFQSELAQG